MPSPRLSFPLAVAGLALVAAPAAAQQVFDSGSDGSDGALTFPENAGTILFDPAEFDPPLDPDGDNVYHFTTITVPAGTTVVLRANVLGEGLPVYWLASGDVVVEGTLDLNGTEGHNLNEPAVPSVAGAGGYAGGRARRSADGATAQDGNGPGGGERGSNQVPPGGGSHATGDRSYGNAFLVPLVGGSGGGGGGGGGSNNSGGGAGGGALLVASSTQIVVSGAVVANGGVSGVVDTTRNTARSGGGGSGGAIRLVAPRLEGSGQLRAVGGDGRNAGAGRTGDDGRNGRIRIEAFQYLGPTDVDPSPSVATPGPVFPPPTAPAIRVTTVDGVAAASDPTGSFVQPDVTIQAASAVTIELETRNIPPGTVLELTLDPETGEPVTTTSTAVAGTLESGTATATATFPSGFTRLFVRATWTPQ